MKSISSIIIIITIFFTIFLAADLKSEDPLTVKTSQIDLTRTGEGTYRGSFSLSYNPSISSYIEEPEFSMFTEELIISGIMENNTLTEEDLLFSQLNIDLNGDGDFIDKFQIKDKSGDFFLGKKRLQIIEFPYRYELYSGYHYFDGKEPMINRVSADGKEFTIYSIDKGKITIGLNTQSKTVNLAKFPNPYVQIIVIKPHDDIHVKPAFSINGTKNYITYSNEKFMDIQADNWAAMVWNIQPVSLNNSGKADFNFVISGIEPPFMIIVAFNISPETNIRLRAKPVRKEILN